MYISIIILQLGKYVLLNKMFLEHIPYAILHNISLVTTEQENIFIFSSDAPIRPYSNKPIPITDPIIGVSLLHLNNMIL